MGVNSDNKSILTLSHVLLLNEMIDVVKMRRSSITVGTLRLRSVPTVIDERRHCRRQQRPFP